MPSTAPMAITTLVPLVLIGSIVVVSLAAFASAKLKRALMLVPFKVRESFEVHRLLTAGWVHGDISHLLFNMLALYLFANQSIDVLGVARFLVVYVAAVVLAFVPTTLRYMRDPRYASLGASGGIAGVMFSAILLHPSMKVAFMFIPVPVPGWIFAIGYLAYSMWNARRGRDHVNHDAHFFGAVVGAGLTFAFEPERVRHAFHALW